jgi:hypothetical protein
MKMMSDFAKQLKAKVRAKQKTRPIVFTESKGEQGKKGEKPVKGVDYWTDADIKELAGVMLSMLEIPPPPKPLRAGKDYPTKEPLQKDTERQIKQVEKVFLSAINQLKKNIPEGVDWKRVKDVFRDQLGDLKIELDEKFNAREKRILEQVKKWIGAAVQLVQKEDRIGGGMASGKIKPHDLSAQADGSTKLFTLPTSFRSGTVALHSNQFPLIYAPTTHFTEVGENQILLTSEVSAPEEGITLVAFYEEK